MLRKSLLFLSLPLLAFATSCKPTPDQIRKIIKDNPDIVLDAIKSDPEKSVEVLMELQQAARKAQMEAARKAQEEQRKEELKNPKKPEISANLPFKGDANAPVVIVEYSDFQCPYCKRGHDNMTELMKMYPTQVKFYHKDLPLPFHPMAMPAAKMFQAMVMQDQAKAWKFYDYVFNNQDKLGTDKEAFLDKAAKEVGADMARLKKDMDSPAVKAVIDADMAEAQKFGITGTPGYIVGGVTVTGAVPVDEFKAIIDAKLKAAPTT